MLIVKEMAAFVRLCPHKMILGVFFKEKSIGFSDTIHINSMCAYLSLLIRQGGILLIFTDKFFNIRFIIERFSGNLNIG